MNFDPLGSHASIGANSRFETLTGQDPVAPDLDRGNADDVVGPHIEAGCLAIDCDDLVNRTWLEQESVRLIADRGLMEKAFDRGGITSEHAEIEVVANEPAELFDHLKRVTQQIALHTGKG